MNAIGTTKQVIKRWNWRKTSILIALIALPLIAATALAPTAITMQKHVIGGGGGHSEVGSFILNSTVGQAVVGTVSNTPYDLCAGFWCGLGEYKVYLPLILR